MALFSHIWVYIGVLLPITDKSMNIAGKRCKN